MMKRTEIDIEACAATLVSRIQARMDAAAARADRLREQARRGAEVLVGELGAKRVWLFGSLAWGEPHGASDVDLLVEGLPRGDAGTAESRLEAIIDGPFDLVLMEEAPPGLAERVLREGRLLA